MPTSQRSALSLPALALCLMVVIAVVSACGGTAAPVASTAASGSTTPSGATATSGATAIAGSATPSGGSVTTTAAPGIAVGEALFAANCVRCHGADLAGGVGPKISGRTEVDRTRIQTHIKSGGTIMPAFGGKFTDAQIVAIADYVISVK
jgi:cytochrome c551